MTRDPIGEDGGINLYGFVGNNPINAVDPYGLVIAIDDAAILAGLAAGAAILYKASQEIIKQIKKGNPGSTDDDCDKEWQDAFKICAKELRKPDPCKRITGGYKTLYDCARGLVSERCGGNKVVY